MAPRDANNVGVSLYLAVRRHSGRLAAGQPTTNATAQDTEETGHALQTYFPEQARVVLLGWQGLRYQPLNQQRHYGGQPGPGPVLAALRAADSPTAEAAEQLRLERGYFAKNAERMNYPALLLDGLPIGSGPVESTADHLVQRRLKRAGMRWSDDGGDAKLALRARLRSGRPLTLPVAA